MFTGIIQAVGRVVALQPQGQDTRLCIHGGGLDLSRANIGDSIAVNGVCLTAVELTDNNFWADVSGETLARSTFGGLAVGATVNLEPSLTLATPLGGHLVSGHVDGVGEVISRRNDGRSTRFVVRAPEGLARYIAEKGSICVDGVSLTVNSVSGARFELNIVPHTLAATTMSEFKVGRAVNLEVDIIARYLERLMLGDQAADADAGGMTREFLARHGFSD